MAAPGVAVADACASLTDAETAKLRRAAGLLARQGSWLPRVGGWLGGRAEQIMGVMGPDWRGRVQTLVEEALWRAQDLATVGLDPLATAAPRPWLARAASAASGAVSGFAGLPGVALDIPFSTMMILRSVAEIARAEGEDISLPDGKRACLEVLALGGPGAADDDAELGYWSARLGLAALNMSAVVPQAARVVGTLLSEKILAQAVPIAGAVAGASLNYAFIRYYQQMAVVHFSVRAVERAHDGDPAVRACLERMVAQASPRGERVGTRTVDRPARTLLPSPQ